ncbi:MAG: patatin-like phospholipase family protein [Gammaproteobacteria bacterium]|nr:patatin-like phospholipase family protein [Gammaproteobacteria bacterium]MDH3370000.1 patatin-like phospholipase family protein [Gammaproteobacteria bacterium]MDH3406034.1 patatin-like phospholipase family protein [Gammaproteobacteria bacterium]MDH3562267.1 patatin-like phospholipase family protein [Gammaproteobacteria bacterium]MDH5486343.1 patatin-like phospholipase family protein [Gammaproteobacteria bacterium]
MLVLGGGGAAGLAHIGVLQEISKHDIPVKAVVGTSIGAEIGAFFASGMPIDELVTLATDFDWKQTLQLFVPDLPAGGLVSGKRIMDFLNTTMDSRNIEDLPVGFAAVTTDLVTGKEVILDRGRLVDAIRASISIPGLIAPYQVNQRWLIDGGVVNPVPVDVARDRFGGPVLAVAVHAAALIRGNKKISAPSEEWPARARQLLKQPWMKRAEPLREWLEIQLDNYQKAQSGKSTWTTRRVLDQAINITQAEIVRLRTERKPPELMLEPDVGRIGLLEFYRGKEAIAAGQTVARERINEIKGLLETN